jgi:tetratricopeptide (TPR) repeat protein
MRGLSAIGRYEEALAHAEKALAQAPDDLNRQTLTAAIERLKAGQDVN